MYPTKYTFSYGRNIFIKVISKENDAYWLRWSFELDTARTGLLARKTRTDRTGGI